MGKHKKGIRNEKKDSRILERGGGSKTLPRNGGEGTAGQHKHGALNSIQNNKGVHCEQEAGPASSGSQVRIQMKCLGESECKELTADGSIDTGFEMSDTCCCTEWRVILKEMMETHPQKDDYIAKFEEHRLAHAVGITQTSEGPSGEQKCDIQSDDVECNTENRPVGLPAEQFSGCDTGEEDGDNEENKMDASAAEERSSVGEDCQAAWGEPRSGEGPMEEYDPWSDQQQQPGNKRRNEDNHSRERSDNQKGRRDKENWRTGDRGGTGCSMKYEDKGYKIVKEVSADLFTAPKESSLAHCVATDMRMGSGIAVSFRQNFKNVGELLDQRARVGDIAVLEHEGRYIYYLVTKKYSTGKPYFDDLVSSLKKMRDHCAEHGVKHLAMPRIGCGLDRLEWRDVKPKIEEVFSGLDISITVYNFNQRWGTRTRSRSNSAGPPHSLCCKNVPKKERKKNKSEKLQKGNQNIKKGKKKKSKNH